MPASLSDVLDAFPHDLLIGGTWRGSSSGDRIKVDDPATGEVLADIADATVDDGLDALAAADAAARSWAETPARDRADLLRAAFDLVMDRIDDLALLITAEMGKPVAQSRGEVGYAAEFLRWFSEEATRVHGQFGRSADGGSHVVTVKQPVGPCVLITPWNFPLAMATRKLGPALAAGCTAVIKPASQTPLTTLYFARLLEQCGLPAGVVNVITTSSSGKVMAPLIQDRRTRKLSFTGSTEVGRRLLATAADNVLRVSMELGGNAPLIVFDDADLDRAVEGTVLAKMRNIGESCVAANRIYVHRDVMSPFADRLAERLAGMKVGRGTDEAVEVGPLIDEDAVGKVVRLVDDATAHGATVVTGGRRVDGPGHFYEPTVLRDVPDEAELTVEEIFGPVAALLPFDDEDDVVRRANDTEHGLVAYVFTQDIDRGLRVSERLEAGMVGLNRGLVSNPSAPFGGVKQSGVGKEGGHVGIEEYLETKYVAIDVG